MPPTREAQQEAELHTLATLIAKCRELAVRLDRLDVAPGREVAPFLYRQLSQALQALQGSVQRAVEHADDSSAGDGGSGGFFGRLKRSLRGGAKKEERKSAEGLQGNSWTIPIPELIGFLSNARKTGALWVHAPNETFLLQIRDGALLHATSDSTPEGERLGELLVDAGLLSAEELKSFLASNNQAGVLGLNLRRAGRISEEDLMAVLAEQIQRLFHRMLSARNSVFRFQEGVELLVQHHVRLNVMQLLLETARTFDEQTMKDGLEALAAGPTLSAQALEEALGIVEEPPSALPKADGSDESDESRESGGDAEDEQEAEASETAEEERASATEPVEDEENVPDEAELDPSTK